MNCTEFERRLHEQFGPSGLVETPDLAEHVEECITCRATWERFLLLSDCLGDWRSEPCDVDLAGRVLAVHRSQSAARQTAEGGRLARPVMGMPQPALQRPTRARSRWLAWGSLAALVIAGVVLRSRHDGGLAVPDAPRLAVVHNLSGPTGGRAVEVLAPTQGDNQAVPATRDSEPPAEPAFATDRALAPSDLTQKAAGVLGEFTNFVMTGAGPMKNSSEPAGRGTAGWMDDLQHELEPIGRSLDDAFDFLWQAGRSADSPPT